MGSGSHWFCISHFMIVLNAWAIDIALNHLSVHKLSCAWESEASSVRSSSPFYFWISCYAAAPEAPPPLKSEAPLLRQFDYGVLLFQALTYNGLFVLRFPRIMNE
jgi:hypothetical protein